MLLERLKVFALPMPKKLLNLIKEWRRYGVFGVKGFNVQ